MSRSWGWVIAIALVVLTGATGYFVVAAHRNRDSAARWEQRAGTLQRTLTARTTQLNDRTDALNKAAADLKRSESEADSLASRQKALANEKAQVEDAQGALESIATEQRQCTSDLTELFNRYAAQDDAWVDANAGSINQTCQKAGTDFASFQAQFGSGQ